MSSADTLERHIERLHPLAVPMAIALIPHTNLDELQKKRVTKALSLRPHVTYNPEAIDSVVAAWSDLCARAYDRDAPHVATLRGVGLDEYLIMTFDWIADLMHITWRDIDARSAD